MESIETIKHLIIEKLKPVDPEKVIIFGSYAWGNPNVNSDIDIYVVTKDDFIPQNWNEKNRIHLKIAGALQDFLREYPTDLVTHTREMYKEFIKSNSSFSKKLLNDGIVIHG